MKRVRENVRALMEAAVTCGVALRKQVHAGAESLAVLK